MSSPVMWQWHVQDKRSETDLQHQSQDTAADCKPQDLFPGCVQGPHPLTTRNSGGLLPGLNSLRLLNAKTQGGNVTHGQKVNS